MTPIPLPSRSESNRPALPRAQRHGSRAADRGLQPRPYGVGPSALSVDRMFREERHQKPVLNRKRNILLVPHVGKPVAQKIEIVDRPAPCQQWSNPPPDLG